MKDQFSQKIFEAARAAKAFDLIDTGAALDKTMQKLGLKSNQHFLKIHAKPVMKVAASILLLASLGWIIYVNQMATQWTTVAATDTVTDYRLPDESTVTLNVGASLDYALNSPGKRCLKLKGEAFFDVTRDETRPFIIITQDSQIEVLGTSFNVNSNDEYVEVSVRSGKVKFGDDQKQVILNQNESAHLLTESGDLQKKQLDRNYLSWKTGRYSFENTPIKEALLSLAKQHAINLIVDQINGDCVITSVFDNQSWKDIKQEFQILFSLQFENQEDGSVIAKGGKSCEK